MNPRYKNGLLVILVLILAAGGWLLFGRDGARSDSNSEDDTEEAMGDEITVQGEIACLQYHINIAGQGCVKGLKGEDGKMYALNSPRGVENTMEEGTEVTAIGTFQPADTSVDDSSVFIYDGVLVVRSLVER